MNLIIIFPAKKLNPRIIRLIRNNIECVENMSDTFQFAHIMPFLQQTAPSSHPKYLQPKQQLNRLFNRIIIMASSAFKADKNTPFTQKKMRISVLPYSKLMNYPPNYCALYNQSAFPESDPKGETKCLSSSSENQGGKLSFSVRV